MCIKKHNKFDFKYNFFLVYFGIFVLFAIFNNILSSAFLGGAIFILKYFFQNLVDKIWKIRYNNLKYNNIKQIKRGDFMRRFAKENAFLPSDTLKHDKLPIITGGGGI